MSSTYQTLQCLLYSGQGLGVFFHASVQAVKFNAEPQATILLPYQHHCIAPGTLAGPDSAGLQHLLQVVLNLLIQWRGYLSKSFLKGNVICYFYHVFCRVGTAQFHWIQREHVVVFGQEPAGSIHQFGGPRVQPTQIQFIKQFTMSLPNSQSGGMGTLGLISPLLQLHLLRWFGHR